jgi:hypothetical protein
MKKVISAWIEQYLQFDSKLEYMAYISELEQKKQRFKEIKHSRDISGKVTLHIRKQYNNNTFPDE